MGGLTRGTPAFFIPCDNCGKKYKILPTYFKRAKTHCCSKECQNQLAKGRYRKRTKRVCVICGKEFWSRDAWTKDRNGGGAYCSKTCRWILKPKFPKKIKDNARNAVAAALRKGVLIKLPCRDCGVEKVEAHHYKGYQRKYWLEVIWLCDNDHTKEHEKLRKKGIRLG